MEWQEIEREEYMGMFLEYELEDDLELVSHVNMTSDPPIFELRQDKGEDSFFDMRMLLRCEMDYLDEDGKIYDGDDGKYYKFYKPM